MTGEPALEFGDRVRIRVGPVTETAGFAGRVGQVHGWTTPSMGYLDEVVVGDPLDDVAVNVNFGDESAWFATDQVEFWTTVQAQRSASATKSLCGWPMALGNPMRSSTKAA
jgi:hypothetical protein